jgi:hypothetical protein
MLRIRPVTKEAALDLLGATAAAGAAIRALSGQEFSRAAPVCPSIPTLRSHASSCPRIMRVTQRSPPRQNTRGGEALERPVNAVAAPGGRSGGGSQGAREKPGVLSVDQRSRGGDAEPS